jgi:hypothetical protein
MRAADLGNTDALLELREVGLAVPRWTRMCAVPR